MPSPLLSSAVNSDVYHFARRYARCSGVSLQWRVLLSEMRPRKPGTASLGFQRCEVWFVRQLGFSQRLLRNVHGGAQALRFWQRLSDRTGWTRRKRVRRGVTPKTHTPSRRPTPALLTHPHPCPGLVLSCSGPRAQSPLSSVRCVCASSASSSLPTRILDRLQYGSPDIDKYHASPPLGIENFWKHQIQTITKHLDNS